MNEDEKEFYERNKTGLANNKKIMDMHAAQFVKDMAAKHSSFAKLVDADPVMKQKIAESGEEE